MADPDRYLQAERALWTSVGLEPTEHRLKAASGGTIRAIEVGAGPPVLFVHGTGSAAANWTPLIAKLQDFRCIAIDRPGCGLSEPSNGGQPYRSIAEFNTFADSMIVDMLDALDLASALVVSTSFGSYFALRGAAAHPKRFDRLVGIAYQFGAPMTSLPMSMRFAAIPGVEAMTSRIPPTRGAVKMILRQLGLKRALASGHFTDEMFEWFLSLLRYTDTLRNEQRSSPKLITFGGMNPDIVFSDELLDRVTSPTLLIWGDEDPIAGEDVARPFAAKIPNATLNIAPQAGHAPWIDDPDRTADLVRDFLRP